MDVRGVRVQEAELLEAAELHLRVAETIHRDMDRDVDPQLLGELPLVANHVRLAEVRPASREGHRDEGLVVAQDLPHPVRLVAPLPLVRRIIRLSDEGELLSARRSPRRGRVEDIFNRLVSIPSLLCQPHFELELLLTHQDELRVYRHGKAFRRHGWVVAGRRLVSVEQCLRITSPDDAACLLPPSLPELFDTAQLAEAAAIERRTAQQMTYCLRAMGVLHTTGKRGNAIVHRRADATHSPQRTSHRLEPPNRASSTATTSAPSRRRAPLARA